MEERKGHCFYLSHEVNKAFTTYSRMSNKPKYILVENALIEYMKNHPIEGVTISVPPSPDFIALVSMVKEALNEDRLVDV